jgi:hypothetical protein
MAQKAELKGKINLDSSGFKRGIAESKKSVNSFIGTLKGSLLPVLGAAGAAGALISYGKRAIQSASQITELAKISGVGVEQFQRYAQAAKTVNIDQEKLADIFKDTSDKMGDFLQVGSGPMVDFFEKIAPMVGATKEEFVGLSGPDALQKYVDYLQQANLPHQDMVFYMEAIASDATLLIPLLEDGGRAFKELGEDAQGAGNIIDAETITALKKAQVDIDRFTQKMTVMAGKMIAAILPTTSAFEDLAEAELKAEGALMDASVAYQYESMGDFARAMKVHNKELIEQRSEMLQLVVETNKEEKAANDIIVAKEKVIYNEKIKAIEDEAKAKKAVAAEERATAAYIRKEEKITKETLRAEEEEEEKASAKRITDAKLELLKAEAAEDSALTHELKNQLELEESIQDIMKSTNVDRSTAVGLAKDLAKANAGADANQSGYITPREQRAEERKQKKADHQRRQKERSERSKEFGAGEKQKRADRDARFDAREKANGLDTTSGTKSGAKPGGETAPSDSKSDDPVKKAATETATNTKEILKEIQKNP